VIVLQPAGRAGRLATHAGLRRHWPRQNLSQGSDDADTRTPQPKTVSKRRRDLESSLPTFQEHTFTFTTHSITAVAEGERPSSILRGCKICSSSLTEKAMARLRSKKLTINRRKSSLDSTAHGITTAVDDELPISMR
jgi:hypothetical protein